MSASMAHVVRPLQVAKHLHDFGYRVVFSGTGKPLRLVENLGFEVMPLPEWDLKEIITKLKANAREIHSKDQVDNWVTAELDLYEEIKPSAILDDGRLTSYISTSVAELPRISIQNAYVLRYAIKGFMDPSLVGPRSLMEPGDEEPYNQVLLNHELPPVEYLSDLLEADLNLLCDVPEYAPVHTIPINFQYVGPLIWGEDLDLPAWFKDLDPDKPTLYVTMGSTGSPQIFQHIINCLSGTEFQVMMTLGSLVEEKDLGELPSDFFVTSYASGRALASRADAIICHGGNGTAYQALLSGIPLITWPSVKDQHWNARRLAELGVSMSVSSENELMSALDEILVNPDYRVEAQKFSKILANYNGPEFSAKLIHDFLDKTLNNEMLI
jgi:UDP:flavonoid glycosyltransferase YjiC (YdhE family)